MEFKTKEELAKLPKWAKEYIGNLENRIRTLENRIRTLEAAIDEMQRNIPASNTKVKNCNNINLDYYLNEYASVEFKDSANLTVRVNVNYGKPGIRIDLGIDGVIIPQARNVIEIHKSRGGGNVSH